jgi:hypothetical protein
MNPMGMNMKKLLPFITLFLSSCAVHHHRYDAEQDAYYQSDYYAYDNYDPYYGYGSMDYSSAGDGVYYSNYNYYPDRWGVTYSNVYYSPYRYPRVGFYYSSGGHCGYSYWSTWCGYSYWPSSYYYSSGWWPSWGLGLAYYSYYDNYWWYNHWRNRNYNHYRPGRHGYNSARNEAVRLERNNRYYRYTGKGHNNQQRSSRSGVVNRSRNTGQRGISTRSTQRSRETNRSRSVPSRQRQQEAAVSQPRSSYRSGTRDLVAGSAQPATRSVAGQQVIQRNATSGLQQRVRQQHSQQTASRQHSSSQTITQPTNRYRQTRVKPMNSQTPVYHTNTKPVNTPSTVRQRTRVNQPANRSTPASTANHQVNRSPGTRTATVQASVKPAKPKNDKSASRKSRSERTNNKGNRNNRSADRDRNR